MIKRENIMIQYEYIRKKIRKSRIPMKFLFICLIIGIFSDTNRLGNVYTKGYSSTFVLIAMYMRCQQICVIK